jgi:hypothetical protein
MTYLIAGPGIDVQDKNRTGECPAGCTGERRADALQPPR